MKERIIIRKAELTDIDDIFALFQGTVRNVNVKDYSPEQIDVWAGGAVNRRGWESAINEQYFVLANISINDNTPLPLVQAKGLTSSLPSPEGNKKLIGFSSIAKDGYLDFIYVHKDFQRCGAATALIQEIERKAMEQKNKEIYSHVSKTAKGFFEKMGYEHIKDLNDPYKGVIFINALMVKKL